MGANNSRKSSESTSPKGLIGKLHDNLHRHQSNTNSSEIINSNLSIKKSLFKRRSSDQDERGTSSPISSIEQLPLTSSPMAMTAGKASARYDQNVGSSYDPSVPQQMSSRLTNCLLDSNDDDDKNGDYQVQLNKVQSNKPLIETSLRGDPTLQKQDMLVHKWLSSYSPSSTTHSDHRKDVVSDFYLRPNNETDRRKQKERQQRLHYLLKHIWKGIYRANIMAPKVIVDWCCGIGAWDMEMAAEFPQAQIIGVDFKEATLSNLQHECPNLKFRHVVIHTFSTGLESFDDNSVDFVMMRDVWFINAPPSKWINVLNESFRILKPGGWIEMTEHSLGVLSPGPCTHKVNTFFREFFEDVGVEAAIAVKLNQYLKDTGFTEINKMSRAVPLGEWADTDELKLIGYLSKDWLERGLRNLSGWVCNTNNISNTEISRLITASMEEELDEFHSYMEWISYTARKPFHDELQTPIAAHHPPTPPTDSSSISSKHS